jgi:hypothetical protein
MNEVNRVLACNGVVALFSYFLAQIINPLKPEDQRLTKLLNDAFYDPIINQYQNSDHFKTVESHYKDIKFPDDYHYAYRDNIMVKKVTNASRIIGIIKSWSHYQQLVRVNEEEAEKFIAIIEHKFREVLGVEDLTQTDLFYNTQYFIAMARKP